jgi:hypothetical protein
LIAHLQFLPVVGELANRVFLLDTNENLQWAFHEMNNRKQVPTAANLLTSGESARKVHRKMQELCFITSRSMLNPRLHEAQLNFIIVSWYMARIVIHNIA